MGCVCGGDQAWTQFGPYQVTYCADCHRLRSVPLVDARVPTHQDHVKALREEIAVEEQESQDDSKRLLCVIEAAKRGPEGASVRLQIMQGDPRWVVAGSQLEGRHADAKRADKYSTTVTVTKKAGPVLDAAVLDPAWADAPRGHQVELTPATNATLYRNLLKAYLVVSRHGDRLHPADLPPVRPASVDTTGLRPGQARAMRLALGSPRGGVVLIQGPPGTGKTHVIGRFISQAVRRGETVLVTSHTHVAIDTALRMALKQDRRMHDKVLRLGEAGKVAPDLLPWHDTISKFHQDPEDPEAAPLFRSLWRHRPVVGMTLDALAHAVLHADATDQVLEGFDHVIVDEAGMNTYPKLAIARAAGDRLVLVGDPLQLPPIVRAWSFRDDVHYKRSHFEVLQLFRPELSVMLDEQFRCQEEIYSWSNDAVYDGKVTTRTDRAPITLDGRGPVLWIDTGKNADVRAGTSRVNPANLEAAHEVVRRLLKAKVAPEDIGYISPFKAQAQRFLESAATKREAAVLSRITASTVDAFQGSERRVILFDLTTRRPAKPHEDHRRLNVSLTRAKDLLIILGPRDFVTRPEDNPFYWSLTRWARDASA